MVSLCLRTGCLRCLICLMLRPVGSHQEQDPEEPSQGALAGSLKSASQGDCGESAKQRAGEEDGRRGVAELRRKPDSDLLRKAVLEQHRKTLSEGEIEDLITETVKLKEIQETPDTPEAMKTVPGLELSDIPKESPKIPTELLTTKGPTVLRHALPTSGVVYADLAFDLSKVPEELLPLVPLYTRALKQLGTGKGDFVDLTRRVGMSTGGIRASQMCMPLGLFWKCGAVESGTSAETPSQWLMSSCAARRWPRRCRT